MLDEVKNVEPRKLQVFPTHPKQQFSAGHCPALPELTQNLKLSSQKPPAGYCPVWPLGYCSDFDSKPND
jgi:hypothetical protein